MESGLASWTFSSSFISSARRLPNGNTLIDAGMNGRMFQITKDGEIVWEFINPWFDTQTYTNLNDEKREISTNWVFRAQPVPYDWVPDDTPRNETAIEKIDVTKFRIPKK